MALDGKLYCLRSFGTDVLDPDRPRAPGLGAQAWRGPGLRVPPLGAPEPKKAAKEPKSLKRKSKEPKGLQCDGAFH